VINYPTPTTPEMGGTVAPQEVSNGGIRQQERILPDVATQRDTRRVGGSQRREATVLGRRAISAAPVSGENDRTAVRVSWPRRLAYAVSITVVAMVAAWNSYWHIVSVAVRGHQDLLLAYSLPASVDGLMLVSSLALAEDKAHGRRPRGWARFGFWLGALVSVAANMASVVVHYGLDLLSIAVAAWPPVALLVVVEIMAKPGKPRQSPPLPAAVVMFPSAVDRLDVAPELARPLGPLSAGDDEVALGPELPATIGELRRSEVAAVAGLIQPALRAAADLAERGRPVTRDALSDELRDGGHMVSNARVSVLLRIVRAAASPDGSASERREGASTESAGT
jgi:Protein of unknown function (DUF2637)